MINKPGGNPTARAGGKGVPPNGIPQTENFSQPMSLYTFHAARPGVAIGAIIVLTRNFNHVVLPALTNF